MHNRIYKGVNTHAQDPPFAAEASAAGAVAVAEPPVSAAEPGSAAGLPNGPTSPMTSKNPERRGEKTAY